MQRILKELAGVIGLADTIELVRRWGGRELYVPVGVQSGDPLALTLGLETARKLVKGYGGQRLQLPAERNALIDLRNAAILRAITPKPEGEGLSHEAAGLRYGLTRQQIGNIARRAAERSQVFAGA